VLIHRPGRGGRGRGGGRGGSAAASRATPASETVQAPVKVGRGRGGHRVKKSGNPRIQALYYRKQDLRYHYKAIAQLQKGALDILATKSLDMLQDDPIIYKTFPEYDETMRELDAQYQKVQDRLDARMKLEKDYLERRFAAENEFAIQKHHVSPSLEPYLYLFNRFSRTK
jgi:hypothetical protein